MPSLGSGFSSRLGFSIGSRRGRENGAADAQQAAADARGQIHERPVALVSALRARGIRGRLADGLRRMRGPVSGAVNIFARRSSRAPAEESAINQFLDQTLRAGVPERHAVVPGRFDRDLEHLQSTFRMGLLPLATLLQNTEHLLESIQQVRLNVNSSVNQPGAYWDNLRQQTLALKLQIMVRLTENQLMARDVQALLESKQRISHLQRQLEGSLGRVSHAHMAVQFEAIESAARIISTIDHRLPVLSRAGAFSTVNARRQTPFFHRHEIEISQTDLAENPWHALCRLQIEVHDICWPNGEWEMVNAQQLHQRLQDINALRARLGAAVQEARRCSDRLSERESVRVQEAEDRLNFLVSLSNESWLAQQKAREVYVGRVVDEVKDQLVQIVGEGGFVVIDADQAALRLTELSEKIERVLREGGHSHAANGRLHVMSQSVARALRAALMHQQAALIENLKQLLLKTPIDELDRARLLENVSDLCAGMLVGGRVTGAQAQRLSVIAHNSVALLGGLVEQTSLVARSALNAEQKQDVYRWLVRLAENKKALLSRNAETARTFNKLAIAALTVVAQDPLVADRLADRVQGASREAACTDWASTVLIDMQAIVESTFLEKNLAAMCEQLEGGDRLAVARVFANAHSMPLARLARFAAFKQFLMVSDYFQRENTESIEQALYLYSTLNKTYNLPGGFAADRMQYAQYVREILDDHVLERAHREAHQMLALPAINENKALLLDNLSVFGVNIWDQLMGLLPERQGASRSVTDIDREIQQLIARIDALDTTEAAAHDDTVDDNKNHADAADLLVELQTRYRLLDSEKQALKQHHGRSETARAALLAAVKFH